MDRINSRHLTNHDGFLQLFTAPDLYKYYVTAAPRGVTPAHEPVFELEVRPGGAERGRGTQYRVKVVWDARTHHYRADPPRLAIEQNDFVLWHCEEMVGSPPFGVRGQGRDGAFDSGSLGPHAVFTHFFLRPGCYAYQVNGEGEFQIDVVDHRELAPEHYRERVKAAPVVNIRGGRPDRERIEIAAGQTVVWTVEHDEGVVIAAVQQPRGGKPAT
jgi:hypothetical protein